MIINLKREVQQLKDQLFSREDELTGLRMSMKLTKIQEIEAELKIYIAECNRLRGIAERAVKLSGEIDVKRIQTNANDQINRANNQLSSL